jgi:M6 family metalloprotease-like protein
MTAPEICTVIRSFIALLLIASFAGAQDLSDYSPPEKATTVNVRNVAADRAGLAGYLGVNVANQNGKLSIAAVAADSPAAKAGLKVGDIVTKLEGRAIGQADLFRDLLLAHAPGESVKIEVLRDGKTAEFSATLTALSKPMKLGAERVAFGAQVNDPKEADAEGTPVERVAANSPAADAGIKPGDVLLKIEEQVIRRASQVADALAERRPGDVMKVTLRRGDKETEVKVTLTVDRGGPGGGGGFGGGRQGGGRGFGGGFGGPAPSTPWTKPVYRLAVVGVEFEDTKHNAKIPPKEWESLLFSKGEFTKKNATGQDVFGSLNDYFIEQSCGKFHVEGKVFDLVVASKKRGDYSQGSGTSNRSAVATEALDKLTARDGKDTLKDFDGVFVIYAGGNAGTNRGSVYYPHAGTLTHQGRRLPYMFCYEGGDRMVALRNFCREFGYLLGLPDLAARTENIGSKGVGVWCLMGGPMDGEKKPQGLCAWSKERLGWLKPAVIDPTVKQKLILGPVSSSPTQCIKVLARRDGSEYFLLENRTKAGANSILPAEGLLIWRVVNDRPLLEESHGIEGPAGPRSLPDLIPFPSKANNSFTPITTPSSRSARGGGLPVHITEIRRLSDGRITLHVGYEYQ